MSISQQRQCLQQCGVILLAGKAGRHDQPPLALNQGKSARFQESLGTNAIGNRNDAFSRQTLSSQGPAYSFGDTDKASRATCEPARLRHTPPAIALLRVVLDLNKHRHSGKPTGKATPKDVHCSRGQSEHQGATRDKASTATTPWLHVTTRAQVQLTALDHGALVLALPGFGACDAAPPKHNLLRHPAVPTRTSTATWVAPEKPPVTKCSTRRAGSFAVITGADPRQRTLDCSASTNTRVVVDDAGLAFIGQPHPARQRLVAGPKAALLAQVQFGDGRGAFQAQAHGQTIHHVALLTRPPPVPGSPSPRRRSAACRHSLAPTGSARNAPARPPGSTPGPRSGAGRH